MMNHPHKSHVFFLIIVISLILAACASASPKPTATPKEVAAIEPTATKVNVTPTALATTTELSPTAVPNAPEKLAPDFELPYLLQEGEASTDEVLKLSDYHGQPVIVNFFASWCIPCRKEMPALEAAYQSYQEDELVIISVGVQDGKQQLMGFALSLGVTFPVVWDEVGQVFSAYRVRGLPTTFFINRAGVVEDALFGELSPQQLEEEIEALLSE
jgi:peroxiredoxin